DRRNPQRAKALFGRLDRQFTELRRRQLERTAVGFGELKVEQAEIRGLGSGAHRAGDPLASVERKAYSQRPTDKSQKTTLRICACLPIGTTGRHAICC